MKVWIERHDTVAFLILTFGISWPLWFASGALTRTPVRAPDAPWLVAQIGVFAPAVAGMVIAACSEPGAWLRALRTLAALYVPASILGWGIATRGYPSFVDVGPIPTVAMSALAAWTLLWFSNERNRLVSWPDQPAGLAGVALWSAIGLLAPVALFLVAWAVVGGTGSAGATLAHMPTRELTWIGLVSAFAMNLSYGGSLGEEPGWRGAWLRRLLRRRSPIAASLVISFWWALWHAPIDLTQGFGFPGVGALVARQIWTLPLTVLFTWVTLRAGGSLLPPLVMHASLNAIPDFAIAHPGRYERAMGVFFVLSLVAAVAVSTTDARLRRVPRER